MKGLMSDLASPTPRRVIDALQRVEDLMREGILAPPFVKAVGQEFERLSRHEDWEVRKAVAIALDHLPTEDFQTILATLLKDPSAHVSNAAKRVLATRTEKRQVDYLGEVQADRLSKLLLELPPEARPIARRICLKHLEMFFRDFGHEFNRVNTSLQNALKNLAPKVARKPFDPVDGARRVKWALDSARLEEALVTRSGEFTAQVTPHYSVQSLRELIKSEVAAGDWRKSVRRAVPVKVFVPANLTLQADGLRLRQAFGNILQNAYEAFDASTKRPLIRIRAGLEEDGRIKLTFKDNGRGMDSETQAEAYQPYRSRKPDGTGYGLPLAKKYIELVHRGSISLTSTEGKGTTVTVVLPRDQP